MLRELELPEWIGGRLLLGGMPGAWRPFVHSVAELEAERVERVVCLCPADEVERRSPEYAAAVRSGALACEWIGFPIGDFRAPADRDGFLALIHQAAEWLVEGETVMAHCAAGIGRTGTFAVGLLSVLGLNRSEAIDRVRAAGSEPESGSQRELLEWVAGTYSLYVVELDQRVRSFREFQEKNPEARDDREALYVGMTGLAPAVRFANHQRGHKANSYVRRFGRRLRPDLFAHLNPLDREEAEALEVGLAESLRSAGHPVWQG